MAENKKEKLITLGFKLIDLVKSSIIFLDCEFNSGVIPPAFFKFFINSLGFIDLTF